MTSEKVSMMLNQQINAELYSAYLYWDFANFFERKGLKGFAYWYKVQAEEEIGHAEKIYDYMQDQGCPVELTTVEGPTEDLKDVITVAELGLKHEKLVTEMIDNIYKEAFQEKDFRTMTFLNWFITEQAEEEANAKDNIALLRLVEESRAELYLADDRMGKRKRAC